MDSIFLFLFSISLFGISSMPGSDGDDKVADLVLRIPNEDLLMGLW